jgi:hypothetical protein
MTMMSLFGILRRRLKKVSESKIAPQLKGEEASMQVFSISGRLLRFPSENWTMNNAHELLILHKIVEAHR